MSDKFSISFYISEIKNRLVLISLNLFSVVPLLFYYRETLLYITLKPILSIKPTINYLICTNVTEGFLTYWSLVNFFCLHFLIFFIVLHSYFFFLPGMYSHESASVKTYFLLSALSFLLLVLVLYNLILPCSWKFFLNIISNNNSEVVATKDSAISLFFEVKLQHYVKFFFTVYISCFFSLQIFLLIFIHLKILHKNSNLRRSLTNSKRKQVYFTFLLLSTVITPPDIISQILLSLVLVLIFELAVFTTIVIGHFSNSLRN